MGDNAPATQREVFEYYEQRAAEVATVGDYVRVQTEGSRTCFGPTPESDEQGWKVVEIDWDVREFILAPVEPRSLDE